MYIMGVFDKDEFISLNLSFNFQYLFEMNID